MNSWEFMFLQSKVNTSGHNSDNLATQNWAWPQETWFQKRLHELRQRRQRAVEVRRRLKAQMFCATKSG